ncbi:MAG: hypothetical protein PWP08_672 [Methanofollis sp.]|nr:hypothetical protein [Methanofollis sp.]
MKQISIQQKLMILAVLSVVFLTAPALAGSVLPDDTIATLTAVPTYGEGDILSPQDLSMTDDQSSATIELPRQNVLNLTVINQQRSSLYDSEHPGTYYFNIGNNMSNGGQNAVHISDSYLTADGTVTTSNSSTGTFYITDTGGKGYEDEAILLIAVQETGSSPDFSIDLAVEGYRFLDHAVSSAPTIEEVGTFNSNAYTATLTASNFLTYDGQTVSQTWKPSTASDGDVNMKLFDGQDLDGPHYNFILVDLNTSVVGRNAAYQTTLTNYGSPKVTYTIHGYAGGNVSFVPYTWINYTTGGGSAFDRTIGWTSRADSASWLVTLPTTEDPTAENPPVANFSAAPTSGEAPLAVNFTDLSTGSPTSWAWDFDNDGIIDSIEQNPTYTYPVSGTYTVNLTVISPAGTSSALKVDYINVTGSRNWTVGATGCDFATITDAINNPLMRAGDTVFVYNGTYDTGSTSASQSAQFNLTGEGADVVTWSRMGAVSLNGPGTVVEGITFTVPAGSGNQAFSLSGSDSVLRNCIFEGGGSTLLYAYAPRISIENNVFRNTWLGQSSYAVYLRQTSNCSVANNTFSNISNGYPVIVYKSTSNTIENNTFTSVRWGIRLNQPTTSDNSIIGNTFTDCSASGGGVAFSAAGPNNMVYLNNFIGNGRDISYSGTAPAGTSYLSPDPITYTYQGTNYSAHLGNYWDTYSGSDADGDGIGDTSYPLRTSEPLDADTSPLIDRTQFFFGATHSPVASVRITPDTAQVGINGTAQFTAKAADTDGLNVPSLTYAWSSSNETVGTANQTGFFTAHAFGETTLTASTAGISNTSTVNVLPPPTVDFTASPLTGTAPLKVQFNDTSANAPTSWLWDFGDGDSTNATVQHPIHTYTVSGIYSVNLTATNVAGSSSIVKTGYINVTSQDPPVASFTANVTSGRAPLTVAFTDTSTGYNITGWFWDFGDGSNATEQNPVHTFTSSGNFTVCLTATNDGGSNATSLQITPSSKYPPIATFSANRTQGRFPLTVQFTDESIESPTSWLWDFGDGTNATGQHPVHTYAMIGEYDVSLTTANVYGSNTTTEPAYIIVRDTDAVPLPAYRNINIHVANDEGVKYDEPNGVTRYGDIGIPYNYVPNTYFFMFGTAGGGTNPMDISNDPTGQKGKDGQVTRSTNQSGEFWVTFTGGQSYMHEGILMLAVNGTIPDDFAVHIRSSGYSFEPPIPGVGNNETISNLTYVEGAVDQTFTKDDFIYGPQIWRPFGNPDLPIYCGQNMSDTENTFQLMFIDLDLGATKTGTDQGSIKVEYQFNNLTSFAVFDSYGWYRVSNHGTGVIMTNYGSDYAVIGNGSYAPAAPVANFSAAPTSGEAPLAVQFTDLSTNAPTSWSWDFGDGATSDEQNPTHTYTTSGTYTVNFTVANAAGSDSEVKTDCITVTSGGDEVASIIISPVDAQVHVGDRQKFTARSLDSQGRVIRGIDLAWSSENRTVGTVDAAGMFTALAPGETTIAAASGTITGTAHVIVSLAGGERQRSSGVEVPGLTLSSGQNGTTKVSLNTSGNDVTIGGSEIVVKNETFTLTITTDGSPDVNNGIVNGTVAGIRLDTVPVVSNLSEIGRVSAAVGANLTGIPAGAGLNVSISDNVSADARSAFQLAASSDGLTLDAVAYVMNVDRTNLENGVDIDGAAIRMSVPAAWVAAHGGSRSIQIIRWAEDGTKEVLQTKSVGFDGDMEIFEAVSPEGLSLFGLVSAAAQQTSSSTSTASGGGGRSTLGAAGAENIKAGETATLVFAEPPITEIEVHAKEVIPEILITTEAGAKPEDADAPEGTVYQYVYVHDYTNVGDSLERATIRFGVPEDWVDGKVSSPDLLSLYRYDNEAGEWVMLSTVFGSEESGQYTYYADTASFGYFAIVVTPDVQQVAATPAQAAAGTTPAGRTTQQQTVPATTAQATPLLGGGMIFCAVFAVASVLAMMNRRRR